MKKKNGFTLIELLAVIIILGVLMIIAVPAVTKYINDSRKSSYINIAKNITEGVRNIANSGKLGIDDKNTTYYIPAGYVKTENGFKSPYGEFTEAYVGVIANDDSYGYYWISRDSSGTGVKNITSADKLENDNIENGIASNEVTNKIRTTGVGNRRIIKILNPENETWETIELADTNNNIPEDGVTTQTPQTISTCEGCVYIYPTETLNFGQNGTVLQANSYDVNYLNVIPSDRKVFLGVKLDQTTNKINKAYVCSFDNSHTPFCLEGLSNNNPATLFESHLSYLQNDTLFGNTCYTYDQHIDCVVTNDVFLVVEKRGNNVWETSIYDNIGYDMFGCFIYSNGTVSCN